MRERCCRTCVWWSNERTSAVEGGLVEARCLAAAPAPFSLRFVHAARVCSAWHGPVAAPVHPQYLQEALRG